MKYLKIQNKGLLDMRLISLMGGTTKGSKDHKIGQFGSGLKYVLAYLFRNNVDFNIYIGENKVNISTVTEKIANEEFNIITVDGKQTSITTKMGMDWKPWMIVRELYSNALDEGEALYQVVDEPNGESDKTTFYIEMTPDFIEVYNNWNKYFVVHNIPMYENNYVAIHPQKGPLKLYKQGILIKEYEEDSLFNYDIKNADINELREYIGTLESNLTKAISSIDDSKIITYFLENVTEELREGKIDYNFWDFYSFSNKWKEVIGDAKIIHKEAMDKLKGAGNKDFSNCLLVPKKLYEILVKKFDGIGALRAINKVNEFYEIYDADLELKVKQALTILEESSYFIHPELKFIFGEFGDKNTLAKVDLDKKEIFISQKMKNNSLFQFCAMLVEENEHFQTGYRDESREFQQHFIDLYVKGMLDKAEIKL